MIDIVGWVATGLVLLGYWLNANRFHRNAMYVWIVGDIGWIIYDVIRGIYPHLALSSIIIIMNIYGIYKILNNKLDVRK
jgi:hypothetical protein